MKILKNSDLLSILQNCSSVKQVDEQLDNLFVKGYFFDKKFKFNDFFNFVLDLDKDNEDNIDNIKLFLSYIQDKSIQLPNNTISDKHFSIFSYSYDDLEPTTLFVEANDFLNIVLDKKERQLYTPCLDIIGVCFNHYENMVINKQLDESVFSRLVQVYVKNINYFFLDLFIKGEHRFVDKDILNKAHNVLFNENFYNATGGSCPLRKILNGNYNNNILNLYLSNTNAPIWHKRRVCNSFFYDLLNNNCNSYDENTIEKVNIIVDNTDTTEIILTTTKKVLDFVCFTAIVNKDQFEEYKSSTKNFNFYNNLQSQKTFLHYLKNQVQVKNTQSGPSLSIDKDKCMVASKFMGILDCSFYDFLGKEIEKSIAFLDEIEVDISYKENYKLIRDFVSDIIKIWIEKEDCLHYMPMTKSLLSKQSLLENIKINNIDSVERNFDKDKDFKRSKI